MVAIKFPPFFAGAAVQAVHLAKALEEKGVSVQFITDNDERKSIHDVYQGLKVYRFSTFLKKESLVKKLIYIVRILLYLFIHHKEFDVVHFHSMRGQEWILFPACKILGKKVVLKVTLVDSDDPLTFTRRKTRTLISWGFRFVDRFVAISSALQTRCLEAGQPSSKVQLIYNGVNTERYIKAHPDEKRFLKVQAGFERFEKVFMSIGKVEHRKGYDLLIDAWPEISASFPNAQLVIAGPGADDSNPYFIELKNKISRLSLWNVFFAGQIENSAEYVRFSDCFLFCSRAEGFGTVLIEAMASGVPVVAMNIPGVTEDIIRDKRIGRICFTHKPEDLAKETIGLLSARDPEGLDQAAQDIRNYFGIDKIADTYIEMYENLMDSKEVVSK